jgi:hypothetical protein
MAGFVSRRRARARHAGAASRPPVAGSTLRRLPSSDGLLAWMMQRSRRPAAGARADRINYPALPEQSRMGRPVEEDAMTYATRAGQVLITVVALVGAQAVPAAAITKCDSLHADSWSAFYKPGDGSGIVRCDNSQQARRLETARQVVVRALEDRRRGRGFLAHCRH